MVVSDVGKVAIQIVFIVGLFAVVLMDKAEIAVIMPILTLIAGVVIGNGAAAVRGHAPSPMLMSSVSSDEVVTIHGSYPVEREINDGSGNRTSHP